ncbi:NAD(+) diphosphatase [Entomomonas asaccharolytica]|uniref:NAD(+) diphosphatase n=1 Tax=Entomomonas asaccharolytica TaxID=2785331 RepID=UPI001F3B0CCE|nr:NAD(+) diphosphatase [Entomomonas asaccharolytica]
MDSFVKANIPLQTTQKNLLLIYANNQFLCTDQYQVLFVLDDLFSSINQVDHQIISLGLWNNIPVHLVILDKQYSLLSHTHWQSLRPLMLQIDPITFKLLGYAAQLATWAIDYKFCGRCGSRMQHNSKQHHMYCVACNNIVYPRLNPCMIILITRGDEILLARSPRFANNMYSTLAGFVEAGESVEDCVHREVHEEVGITINNLRYIGSQNWPYPYSLMLGFHADYAAGEITPQPDEIEDAQWFTIKKLPELPPKQAISRYLIDLYIAEKLATAKPTFPH